MNLIPRVPASHSYFAKSGLSALIYFYLLSATNSRRGDGPIYSDYELIDLLNKFKLYEESDISVAFETLKFDDVIRFDGSRIEIGERLEGNILVFSSSKLTLADEEETVGKYADAFVDDTNGATRARAKTIQTNLATLFSKSTAWKVFDFLNFFRYVHEVYFQGFHREFTNKEAGQMKNLVNLYDQITLAKMITYYIVHNEQFGKSSPTVASLVYNKDDIEMKIRGGSQRSKATRTTNVSQDF